MMSRHFALSSELSGAIAKRLPHAKNQLSASGSFFNQFVTDIYSRLRLIGSLFNRVNRLIGPLLAGPEKLSHIEANTKYFRLIGVIVSASKRSALVYIYIYIYGIRGSLNMF